MSVTILTPLGGLVALVGLVPLLALHRGDRRARAVARSLGLPADGRARTSVAAVAGVAALLGLAASQPVVALEETRHVRTDAEIYVVLDTSRSMLASAGPGAATRLDRAKDGARTLRATVADVPVGIASLTDRLLPHLFPSGDPQLFDAVLDRSVRDEHPPPERDWVGRATTFAPLSKLATTNFYAPTAKKRAVVLLTDGETRPYSLPALVDLLGRSPAIVPVAIHVWREREQVWTGSRIEGDYTADPTSREAVSELAAATGGTHFGEGEVGDAARAVRAALGPGEAVAVGESRSIVALAPWLVLAAGLPLAFLVVRRIV